MSYIFSIPAEEITTIPDASPSKADYVKKNDTFETWRKKTNWLIQDSGRDIVLGTDTSGNFISTIAGTANQVLVAGSGSESSTVTLSLPQSIGTSSNVVFGNINGTVITGSSLVATSTITSPSITVSGTGSFAVLSVSGSSNVIGKGTFGQVETPNLKVTSSADFTGVDVTARSFTGTTVNGTTITGNNITGSTSVTSPSISATTNLFSPVANLTTLTSTTVTSTNGNFTNLSSNNSTIGSGTFSTSLTSNGTLLVLGNSEVRGDLSVTNGKKLVIPSGITNIRNNEYTWPASANIQNTYLKYGSNGQLSWSEINVSSAAIVFEDVVPVGVIVRWDQNVTLPNTKWAYCNNQLISSLSITQADKDKLNAIYPGGRLPTTSSVIIKIASDYVKRFSVNLAEGITGTKNGGTVTLFDATSDSADAPTLVTLKVNYDTNTLAIAGNQLKVKDATFLPLASGGTVSGQVKVNGGSNVTLANTTGNLIVGNNSSTHIAIDGETLQARNNGSSSTLELNPFGGAVTVTAAPSAADHVVNKTYADTKLASIGGTITGPILYSPASFESTHLVNKAFVDTNFLNKITGGSLSVPITSPAPSADGHLVNKTYADGKLALTGGTVTGKILVTGTGATIDTANQLVTKDYADLKLALTGGTINSGGSISWATAPTADAHLVNKAFVDGNTLSSVKDSSTTGIISVGRDPVSPLEVATKQYVDRITDHQILRFNVNLRDASDSIKSGPSISAWSRESTTINSITFYEYTYTYLSSYEPYVQLEPGHWIPTGIANYLYDGIYQISSNVVTSGIGYLKFMVQHSDLPTGFTTSNKSTTVTKGTASIDHFGAALDGDRRVVVVFPAAFANKAVADTLCLVNLKSGYELPPLSNDIIDENDFSRLSVDLKRLHVSSNCTVDNSSFSSTILSRARTYEYTSKFPNSNPLWFVSKDETSDKYYTFSRKTIPVGIATSSYFACVDISYRRPNVIDKNTPTYNYISMASVGYSYSNNPASPIGTAQGNSIFDDSAVLKYGENVLNQRGIDGINVKWNTNTLRYDQQFGTNAVSNKPTVYYAVPENRAITWSFGNEGKGPHGAYSSGQYMVSITDITTGKIKTYILLFKAHQNKTAKSISFRDGKFYYNYGTDAPYLLVNGVTDNSATTVVSSVTT
jgi:hypothetical protein